VPKVRNAGGYLSMAYRKSSGRKFHPRQVLPSWSPAHTAAINMAFLSLMERFGITDIPSYFRKLRIPIVISVAIGACIGASSNGFSGLLIGALLGLIAPVGFLWLGVVVAGIVIYLAVYFAAWAVILCVLWWLISS
jgi:hypothetical protein